MEKGFGRCMVWRGIWATATSEVMVVVVTDLSVAIVAMVTIEVTTVVVGTGGRLGSDEQKAGLTS